MRSLKVRDMAETDLGRVLLIEKASFRAPFSRGTFKELLENESCFSWVVLEGEVVLGYAVFSLVIDESELINIAVEKTNRRRGIGRFLMKKIIRFLEKKGAENLFLEVRPSNLGARSFYEGFGFVKINVRRGYYEDNREDAYVLARRIS